MNSAVYLSLDEQYELETHERTDTYGQSYIP